MRMRFRAADKAPSVAYESPCTALYLSTAAQPDTPRNDESDFISTAGSARSRAVPEANLALRYPPACPRFHALIAVKPAIPAPQATPVVAVHAANVTPA